MPSVTQVRRFEPRDPVWARASSGILEPGGEECAWGSGAGAPRIAAWLRRTGLRWANSEERWNHSRRAVRWTRAATLKSLSRRVSRWRWRGGVAQLLAEQVHERIGDGGGAATAQALAR